MYPILCGGVQSYKVTTNHKRVWKHTNCIYLWWLWVCVTALQQQTRSVQRCPSAGCVEGHIHEPLNSCPLSSSFFNTDTHKNRGKEKHTHTNAFINLTTAQTWWLAAPPAITTTLFPFLLQQLHYKAVPNTPKRHTFNLYSYIKLLHKAFKIWTNCKLKLLTNWNICMCWF